MSLSARMRLQFLKLRQPVLAVAGDRIDFDGLEQVHLVIVAQRLDRDNGLSFELSPIRIIVEASTSIYTASSKGRV